MTPRSRRRWPPAPPRRRRATRRRRAAARPSPRADAASRSQVTGQRERHAVEHLRRLEDAVAHGEAVVEHRHPRLRRRRRTAPSSHTFIAPSSSTSSASRAATASSRRAFSSVSSHSRRGVRAPGDAGAGAEVQRGRTRRPEGPDADRQGGMPPVGVHPARPPRSTGRAAPARGRAIAVSALDLGAPVTEPGGKVAASSVGQPASGRSRARTVDTRCTRPGCCSTAFSAGHLDRAGHRDRAEVVAHQVDDHHVLGPVLGGEPGGGRGGALDRPRLDQVAGAAQEQLRRRGHHVDAGRRQPDDTGVRRGVALGEQAGQAEQVGARLAAARTAPGRG